MFNIYAESFLTATRTDSRQRDRRDQLPPQGAKTSNPRPWRAVFGLGKRR